MPQPSIRPDVVALLTSVDASRRDDLSRLYRRDGSPFTAAEHDLLHTCTLEEIVAAKAQRRLEADWKRERHAMKALVGLFMKYFDQLPGSSLGGDAYALMTDEDYAEFDRLVEAISARTPFGYAPS